MYRKSFVTAMGAVLLVVLAAATVEAQTGVEEDLVALAKRKFKEKEKELTKAEEKLLQKISSGDTADL